MQAAEIGSDVQDDMGSVTDVVGAPAHERASDPHDFAGLYLRHRASFTLHARRYLRDQRDADEVVQEAFLRLFLALPELETELQALAYCRRTITNLAIDRYRADARRPKLIDLDSAPVDELAGEEVSDPVVRAEEAALVRDALAQLPSLHRAALVKREIEEKPLSVIADELDIPEDNVKHVLFRARRALRKLLARTAVAPGADDETGTRPARSRTGAAVALAVLLALGLGSGPDLEAVPVVGVDLPDVLGVTRLVETVGDVVDRVLPGDDGPQRGAAAEDRPSRGAQSPDAPAAGGTAGTTQPGGAVRPATGAGPAAGAPVVPGSRPPAAGVPGAAGQPAAVPGMQRSLPGVGAPAVQVPDSSGPGGGAGTRPDSPTGRSSGGETADRDAAERADEAAEDAARAPERAARDQAREGDRAAREQARQDDRAAREQADRAARERDDRAAREQAEAADKAAKDQAKAAEKAAKDQARANAKAAKDRADSAERAAEEQAKLRKNAGEQRAPKAQEVGPAAPAAVAPQ